MNLKMILAAGRRLTLRTCFFTVMSLLWIDAYGDRTWHDVASVEMGTGTLRAGDLVRLEPTSFRPVEMSNHMFTNKQFKFSGILLDNSSDLEIIGNVTSMSGGVDDPHWETRHDATSIQWGASESQKKITINFVRMPKNTGPQYQGNRLFYFYVTDSNGACISNIVAWPVTFK